MKQIDQPGFESFRVSPEIFAHLPKVELHLHLEGAFPLWAMWSLIQKYGGDPEVSSPASLRERFDFKDFGHFIQTWVWKNGFLREYEDFTFIAEATARSLAEQKIVYAEMFFSPADFLRHGLETCELAMAIRRGLDRVSETRVSLIADLVRDYGPERASGTLERVLEVAGQSGIVGVGLGGTEKPFPPEPFKSVFARASKAGLGITAHAGEAAGPMSIVGAVEVLGVTRIGHGTAVTADPRVIDLLLDRGVAVEACPISNLRTGVLSDIREHPIGLFLERGVPVSLNTDDPLMFGNTLNEEFAIISELLGVDGSEAVALCRRISVSAARSAWLMENDRIHLENMLLSGC